MPTTGLLALPYDVVDAVASYIDVRDYVHLSETCRKFHHDLDNDTTAKNCLQAAQSYARLGGNSLLQSRKLGSRAVLQQTYDRSEALRTSSPFSITLLAHASSFAFADGLLCYVASQEAGIELRVLDIANESEAEKVIDAQYFKQKLPTSTVESINLLSMSITGISHSIVAVVCDYGLSVGSYLYAVNVADKAQKRILLMHSVRSTNKIFTRHDSKHLYYGTHSATGSLEFREWLIQGFDLEKGTALSAGPLQLCNFAGSDLHSVVDFTIYNGEFYAITNQTSFESEEINWTSFYCYIRFPCASGGNGLDDLKLKTIWRRQDLDGPINDAFTNLTLQVDDRTGELLIIEIRKEWRDGASSSTRTCYMQPFEKGLHDLWENRRRINLNDRISQGVEKDDNPSFVDNIPRAIDKYLHREFSQDFAGARHEYTKTKTKWSTYSYNVQTFVELVVDDVEVADSWRPKECLRLRTASRVLRSPLVQGDAGSSIRKRRLGDDKEPIEGSEEAYKESEVFKRPRLASEFPEVLEELMCPGGKAGDVKAVLANEGIIYMAGTPGTEGQRALIYLSFDRTFAFDGMRKLDGSLIQSPTGKASGEPTTGMKRKATSLEIVARADEMAPASDHEHSEPAAKRPKSTYFTTELRGAQSQYEGPTRVTDQESESRGAPPRPLPLSNPAKKQPLLYKTKARYLDIRQGWRLR